MTPVTRVKCSSAALAAALLLGLAAPAASAHAPGRSPARDGHRIPFTAATVTDHADGTSTVAWTAPGARTVTVRSEGRTVARGGASGSVTVPTGAAADRHWFDLVPDRGTPLRLADRLIRLQGTVNFRDAGGYRTRDGQWVRMGEVYRSDALDRLTDADLAKLRRLGVRTVLDLRMESERAAAPDRVPAGATHVVADVLAGSGTFTAMPESPAEAEAMMVEGNRFMVGGATAKAAYATVLDEIADGDGVLFHCTAGKDRTGWAEAALLTALGVPEETVMADYLASGTYRAAADEAVLSHLPPDRAAVYKPLLDVRPQYLNASFDRVGEEFGSFRAYLRKGVDLDAHELRTLQRRLLVG
ncbi:tyrosine-protein phosphatase [Streptomyces omiyaensis]|uniref:Tyrosine-protein phosphatase n=1 Tax=Streptomyces omiyaensis TaxID=68247 RepID=A0ABW7BYT1_9ACTN|nr:tyrosine-protein phosphatase [Streptomyces omiyaensis]GGY69527.1 protein-tyrosine-phosphatase [Streptomyces omiyaensis]